MAKRSGGAGAEKALESIVEGASKEKYTYRGKEYGVHPAAYIFPLLESSRYEELLEDAKKVGIQDPITVRDGLIWDGRNRMRVAVEGDLDVEIVEPPSDVLDPYAYVVSKNLLRRDMTPAQRAMAARNLKAMSERASKEAENEARKAAAVPVVDAVLDDLPSVGPSDSGSSFGNGDGGSKDLPTRPSAEPLVGGPAVSAEKSGKGAAKPKPFVPTPARGEGVGGKGEDAGGAFGIKKVSRPDVAPVKALTSQEAADAMGVSKRSLERAERVSREAPELAGAVGEGVVKLRDAEDPDVLGAPAEIREKAVEDVKKGREKNLKDAVVKRQDPSASRKPKKRKGKISGGGAPDADLDTSSLPQLPSLGAGVAPKTGAEDKYGDPGVEIYSPKDLVMIVRTILGAIELDPCSSDEAQLGVEATEWYGQKDNGTKWPWKGKVYCFPPLAEISAFAGKLDTEFAGGNVESAVFLAPSETGAEWAQKLLAIDKLTVMVHRKDGPGLVTAPQAPGNKPGEWRPRLGLTAYVYGVVPTQDVIVALSNFGYVFRRAGLV